MSCGRILERLQQFGETVYHRFENSGKPTNAFHEAVRNSDANSIKEFAHDRFSVDVDSEDPKTYPGTPLYYAVDQENAAMVDALLEQGANPFIKCHVNEHYHTGTGSPFHRALAKRNPAILELLLKPEYRSLYTDQPGNHSTPWFLLNMPSAKHTDIRELANFLLAHEFPVKTINNIRFNAWLEENKHRVKDKAYYTEMWSQPGQQERINANEAHLFTKTHSEYLREKLSGIQLLTIQNRFQQPDEFDGLCTVQGGPFSSATNYRRYPIIFNLILCGDAEQIAGILQAGADMHVEAYGCSPLRLAQIINDTKVLDVLNNMQLRTASSLLSRPKQA